MNHDDGNDSGLFKHLTPIIIGVVFRVVVDLVLSFFKRTSKVAKEPPTDDESNKPGC